jgi:hypothetical protein
VGAGASGTLVAAVVVAACCLGSSLAGAGAVVEAARAVGLVGACMDVAGVARLGAGVGGAPVGVSGSVATLDTW